ncbi:MAG: 4-hydroxy-tetrahydrodipicolinate reductase [Lachnospiraceae bacterium]|nr:4-hydroxy-tetrahydrodipicolinate reductase [Lachnospiraceae bacterium]
MVNILMSGVNGKMGQAIVEAVAGRDDAEIVCGVDTYCEAKNGFPVYADFTDIKEKVDIIIDFSNPSALSGLLNYSLSNGIPCVLCTTGYSEEQIESIKKASERVAVFRSGNMSLGINLLIEISKMAAKVFGSEFDIEIVEKHHNRKIDAPSGTALMIADEISEVMNNEPTYVYDRHSVRKKRDPKEVGIHSVRGGTIVGEHDVIFAGANEVVTISHQAQSRSLFAVGAVNAAVYLADKGAGSYDMSDLLKSRY